MPRLKDKKVALVLLWGVNKLNKKGNNYSREYPINIQSYLGFNCCLISIISQ